MMPASPASLPISSDSDEKIKKYDRQLRLWGDHGQSCLEQSSVCVLGCSALSCELLKSLVLAGVGSFTIVDNVTTTQTDVDDNYFIDVASVGEPRGRVASQSLLELNPDVRGSYVHLSGRQLLELESERLTNSSLVVATDFADECMTQLADLLWQRSVPLVVCRACGFFGTIRVQAREHLVVESHPDSSIPDFRLSSPFPALQQFVSRQPDLNQLTRQQHQHVPYLLLLLQCLQMWRTSHNCHAPPSSRVERQQFRDLLQQMRLKNEDGVCLLEENFDEADKAVNTCFVENAPSHDLQQLFQRDECCHLTAKSEDFWVLLRALRDFVEQSDDGLLPVRGQLPDMFSDSHTYVALQQIYREKARADSAVVYTRVQSLLEGVGRSSESDGISEDRVRHFCTNAHALRHYVGTCLSHELLSGPRIPNAELAVRLNGSCPDLSVYVVLRAAVMFKLRYGCEPGASDQLVDADSAKLKACVSQLLSDWGCSSSTSVPDDYVQEVCRYGGVQIHSVVSFIGGCAAHEVIKLLTGQYVPIDNTFVYNAITNTTSTFKF